MLIHKVRHALRSLARAVILVFTLLGALVLPWLLVAAAPSPLQDAPTVTVSPEALAAVTGVLLSLAFSYVPQAKDWFEKLSPTQKRLAMLGLLLVSAGGSLVYACRGAGPCYSANMEGFVKAFSLAAIANQTTFLLAPKPKS